MQGARPIPPSLPPPPLNLPSLSLSPSRPPAPSPQTHRNPNVYPTPLCSNSKPPPETVASLFAFYPRTSTGRARAPRDINFTRESNNKCWTFAASQVYRRCRRFTRAKKKRKEMKKQMNIGRIGRNEKMVITVSACSLITTATE